ncbi:MAG: MMPL family transporter, partial [Gemmatimonadota bacterium]|nr:MMPL family transporter [Gemmatimonadota bacterium]
MGILDGIHVVSHYLRRTAGHRDPSLYERQEIMVATASDIGPACLLTSATTCAAFISFALSGIASFAQFGLLAAWGIAGALLLSFSLLPVLVVRLPLPGDPRAARRWDARLSSLLAFVHRRGRLILVAWAALFLLGAGGLAQVKVEVQPEQLMGEDNQVMVWNRWLRENLRETESVEITLELPPGLSFAEPVVLAEVDHLANWLSARERLVHPRSVLLPLLHMNQVLHAGDESFARYEDTRVGNAQLAAVVRLSDHSLIDQWVSDFPSEDGQGEREYVRISMEAEPMSTASQARLVDEIQDHLLERLPAEWEFELTGSVPMYLEMMTALQASLFKCFAIAALTVFVVMMLAWGSIPASLLAIVPTLVPVVVVVGLLGWWDFGLDPASTMVATVVLGVAVDDGIHLVSSYRSRRGAGAGSDDSLAHALRHVGPALVT